MREKVAKAIYEQRNGAGAVPWSRRDNAHKQPYLNDADAVLDALMEPTEDMREMGDHAYNLTGICGSLAPSTSYEHTEFIWQAMINAAKEGG